MGRAGRFGLLVVCACRVRPVVRALLNAMRHRPTVALPLDSVAVVCRRITHIVNLSGCPATFPRVRCRRSGAGGPWERAARKQ